jgi:monoamine oxidase
MCDLDVVVVGGGISGLAVADGLGRAGLTVKVIEARRRLGGRICSMSVPGGRADLGATWFWPGENRVRALVEDLDLDVHAQSAGGDILVSANGQVRRVTGHPGVPAFQISSGTGSLIEALAARLPAGVVQLDTAVQRLEPHNDHVVVHVDDEVLRARVAVVALPPMLAMASGIIDGRDLDADLRAVASTIPVWMGSTTKAVAVYSHPFWRQAGLSGVASCPGEPLHEVHDMSGPDGAPAMLFGFGQTPPRGAIITAATVTKQFAALFGPEAAAPLDVLIRDWSLEKRTSPRHWPLSQRYDLFGSPLLRTPTWHGRLLWTSTETSAIAPGHMEGALAAADRTVQTILDQPIHHSPNPAVSTQRKY